MRLVNLTEKNCARKVCANGLRRVAVRVSSLLFSVLLTSHAVAATFVVNSTTDAPDLVPGDGACDTGALNSQANIECSLRAAIQEADFTPASDNIDFNIPVTEAGYSAAPLSYTIQPGSALPSMTRRTVINGTTQPDFPGTPIIVIDGIAAGATTEGLHFAAGANGSIVRSLVINNFSFNGVLVQSDAGTFAGNYIGLGPDGNTIAANNSTITTNYGGVRLEGDGNTVGGLVAADRNVLSGNGFAGVAIFGGANNVIVGNYIGVDANGTLNRGNSQEGIDLLDGTDNRIGGTSINERNILSGNGSDGIEIDGSAGTIVQGNYIGTDVTGTVVIPNVRDGIDVNENAGVGTTGSLIGGTAPGAGNLIVGNQIYGVSIRDALTVDNAILGNSIYGNTDRGIDLNNDAQTPNDPGDGDAGSNDLLNYPVLVRLTELGGTVTARFDLDVPAGDYRIEFFSNPGGTHPSGFGDGEIFAGAASITHGGTGVERFVGTFPGSVGDVITATATEDLGGGAYASTSEYSAPLTVAPAFAARWPLDETSGVTADDILGPHDGTYLNGVTLNQIAACAITGTGVYFDGVDDVIEVPHDPAMLLDEGTVTFWARADATGADQGLWTKDSNLNDNGGHLRIKIDPTGQVSVRLQSTTADYIVTHGIPVTPGQWFHVSFSWGPAGMVLYVDALSPVFDAYTGGLGTTSGGSGNDEPIAIGANTDVSGDQTIVPLRHYFAGYMDDVRLYDYALTLPEIQALAGCTPPAPTLEIVKRAFWPDGTPIPTGATIPSGVEFKYLLYVNNTDIARTDVTVQDLLAAGFQYQPGTLQVDNSVAECAAAACTVAEEAAIFTAVEGAGLLTDAVDADVASYNGGTTTIDVGDGNVANAQLDINADSVLAILFSVKMP